MVTQRFLTVERLLPFVSSTSSRWRGPCISSTPTRCPLETPRSGTLRPSLPDHPRRLVLACLSIRPNGFKSVPNAFVLSLRSFPIHHRPSVPGVVHMVGNVLESVPMACVNEAFLTVKSPCRFACQKYPVVKGIPPFPRLDSKRTEVCC